MRALLKIALGAIALTSVMGSLIVMWEGFSHFPEYPGFGVLLVILGITSWLVGDAILGYCKRLTRELDQVRMKSASSSTANIGDRVKEVKGVKVLTHRVDNLERAQLHTLVDQLRDKIGSGVVILGSASYGNVALIVGVTKDLTGRVQAGKVIGPVAQKVGGKGGGRPDLAEAGGKDAAALDAALDEVYGVVEGLLA